MILPLPPLALYLHLPWCERKCPYCDFNSHARDGSIPEGSYLQALFADFREDQWRAGGRDIETVFIGGGTPSLFSATAIGEILSRIAQQFTLSPGVEVTLEANPGSAEQGRFRDFRAAGVNRISIGVQSFTNSCLHALGRIHDADQARAAIIAAQRAGFDRINIDLMHGLPGQNINMAMADLDTALEFDTGHLSWYQLTIEPNTVFARRPPTLPVDDLLADIQDQGQARLAARGYCQYEVSAFARNAHACWHNRNYWEFGDYLGFGAGAHGKQSYADGRIERYWKTRQPENYMAADTAFTAGNRWLAAAELPLEFMMNALRLVDGVATEQFSQRTGVGLSAIAPTLERLRARGLLVDDDSRVVATPMGMRFLNELLAEF